MQLSMWVLADRLKKYEPEVRVRQGDRILQNARLFSDDLKITRSTVYLNQLQENRVLCSAGHDMLLLYAEDINDVFNDILDIFETYNEFSADTYKMIRRGCSAGDILDCGAEMLGRVLILADTSFYMREIRGPGEMLSHIPSLRNSLSPRMLPLDALLKISTLPQIRTPELPTYRVAIPGLRPDAAVTNLFSNGLHRGWLISVNESGEYSRGDFDLQDAFSEFLTAWIAKNDTLEERMDRSGIFLGLLEHPEASAALSEDRLKPFGWYPADRKCVYTIRQLDHSLDPMYVLEGYLRQQSGDSFLVHYEGQLLYIVNCQLTPPALLEESLRQTLCRCGCAAGKSPIFTELQSLAQSYRASLIALEHGDSKKGSICAFEDAVLPYAAHLLREKSAVDLRHPALSVLSAYDAEHSHGGSLAETLSVFLRSNCSFSDAAAALFIHRSTLLYRLDRIRALTGLDLEDSRTRLHLLLSFLMDGDQLNSTQQV